MAYTVQPYIDRGELALPVKEAFAVFDGARDLLSRYIGPIVLHELRAVVPAVDAMKVNPMIFLKDKTRADHVSLLTRRKIWLPNTMLSENAQKNGLAGICYYRDPNNYAAGAATIISADRLSTISDIDMAVTNMTHEWTHSLGVDHCKDSSCLMQESMSSEAKILFSVSKKLFCDPHLDLLDRRQNQTA